MDRKGRNRAAAAGLGLALAGALAVLAAPGLPAGLAEATAASTVQRMQSGAAVVPAELDFVVANRAVAAGWWPHPRFGSEASAALVRRAWLPGRDDAGRRADLEAARSGLLAVLAAAPANGYAWMRLALVEGWLGASPDVTAAAIARSLEMVAYDRRLDPGRMAAALSAWEHLPRTARLAVVSRLAAAVADPAERTWAEMALATRGSSLAALRAEAERS